MYQCMRAWPAEFGLPKNATNKHIGEKGAGSYIVFAVSKHLKSSFSRSNNAFCISIAMVKRELDALLKHEMIHKENNEYQVRFVDGIS